MSAVRDLTALESLAPHWEQLVPKSDGANAFGTPAAGLTWYRHVKQHSGIYVVAVWRGEELVLQRHFVIM